MRVLLISICATVLTGCEASLPTVAPSQPQIVVVYRDNIRYVPSQENSYQNSEKLICLQKYNIALNSCNLYFRGEENGAAFQNNIVACLANRGFPQGSKNCE